MRCIGLSLLVLLAGTGSRVLGQDRCDGCGQPEYQKVCKIVCEMKKVTKHKWGCKCEDICLKGPSEEVCCETGPQDTCDHQATSCCPSAKVPACGRIITRKKLIRYEVTEEVPVYKCVVEYVPCGCAAPCDKATPELPAPKAGNGPNPPPAPAVDTANLRPMGRRFPRTVPLTGKRWLSRGYRAR